MFLRFWRVILLEVFRGGSVLLKNTYGLLLQHERAVVQLLHQFRDPLLVGLQHLHAIEVSNALKKHRKHGVVHDLIFN